MEKTDLVRKTLAAILWALTLGGVVRAQEWERLGPEGGMVVTLGIGSGTDVYLATADGHVFASKDGAQSWQLRGRVGHRLDAVVTRILIDSREPNRIFASVWYQQPGTGGGVFESEDGARSWKLLGLQDEAVRALEVASSQPDELVAGTRAGVFRSLDRGKRWERISPEGDEEIRNLDSLAIDPRDPQVIYAGTYHLPWLTRDGGRNWKPVAAGIIDDSDIMSLRLDSTNPSRVYMSACSGIYRSENQGENWIKLQGIPYAARRTQVIVQDPESPKTLYAGTTAGLWVTRDSGESWTRTTSKDWVVNSITVLPASNGKPGRVVLGTEGGVQISDDAGVTFAESNRGFTHAIVEQLVADQHDNGRLLMVTQRAGADISESRNSGDSWTSIPLTAIESGKPVTLDAGEVQDVFASPWGWLMRFDGDQFWLWREDKQSWKRWKLILPLAHARDRKATTAKVRTPSLKVQTAIAFSGTDAMLATNEGLVRCQESGICARLKGFGHATSIRSICISPDGREISVVADDKLGFSSDGGATAVWEDLPLPQDQITWMDALIHGPQKTILLGTSKGIFRRDASPSSWQKVEGGLPAGPVGTYLAASDIWVVSEQGGGLYVSQDKGANWNRVDRDDERGRFTGLVATPTGGILAGSQSEGLLRLAIEKAAARNPSNVR
jgi:photosystem II stability/assembly factor-like uncharacterized protein